MNQQQSRTLQEMRTSQSPDEVLAAAKDFFANRPSLYAAFIEQESATHVALRGQGGEEILIGVRTDAEGTEVTGSSYLFDQQIARFMATLPPFPTEDASTGPEEEADMRVDDTPMPVEEKKA